MTNNEFDLADDICYLNHAAVSPWPRCTVDAVKRFAAENGRVGSHHYGRWLATEQALRVQLQSLINASSSDEIALLKSTSEALSVVAYGMHWTAGDEIIISNQEFPSNRIVWESLRTQGVEVVTVDIDHVDDPEQHIIDAITPRTRLVSLSSVQYASGLALDLALIGVACRQHNVAFCIDAIQSLGVKPLDVQACHADFVMADGHKWMLGPEGIALFYCRSKWLERLDLKQYGWHMVQAMGDYDRRDWQPANTARRFECGSPNMLGIHALHASLHLILETGVERILNTVSSNIQYLIDNIKDMGGEILSETRPEMRAGIMAFRFKDEDISARYQHLQDHGVICALRAGGIRFSPHFYTPRTVLERALAHATEPLKI
ncbi:MAG: aminotransferase class V-fold PLP-dependent enzyme [Gammaproteobacteria bacterium]|nr:MAG: aminotransferase class V-fold PLP-dependent enzyme [Gammaproteobacteria bacterium]